MVDYEKILVGVEILNEFKDKLTELCEEYRDKVREVCPEDLNSKYIDIAHEVDVFRLNYLQFYGTHGKVTQKELEDNGFMFNHGDGKTSFYTKKVGCIKIDYSVDTEEKQDEV